MPVRYQGLLSTSLALVSALDDLLGVGLVLHVGEAIVSPGSKC